MSLGRNIVAGLVNSIWSAILGLVAVRFYLRFVGIDGYGLIAFAGTVQGIVQVLDFGLAMTVNREIALRSGATNYTEVRALVRSAALIYWMVALIIACVVAALAPILARHWLESNTVPEQTVVSSVVVMGVMVGCRWPSGLYQAVLMGAHRQYVASVISAIMSTLGSVGAVAVLAVGPRVVQSYFVWQAGIGLLLSLVMGRYAWRVLGPGKAPKFDLHAIRGLAGFTGPMGGVTIAAIVLTFLDKIILSRLLSLSAFGQYMLGWAIVGVLLMVVAPIFTVLYAKFSALFSEAKNGELFLLYRHSTRLLCVVIFPLGLAIATFSRELVLAWTGSPSTANAVAPTLAFLSIGTSLNCVMHIPHALQLASGAAWLALWISLGLIFIFTPLVTVLTILYGPLGGAIAWAALNDVFTLGGSWLTHRCILQRGWANWLFQDVGLPLVAACAVILLGRLAQYEMVGYASPTIASLAYAGILGVLASFAGLLLLPRSPGELRPWRLLRQFWSQAGGS